jgi:Flp pilus assembly protein TadG
MTRDDRGAAALEVALVAPALMLVILGVLQFGLWHHAQQVVQAAAQEGARMAAAEGAEPTQGRDRALEVLSAGLGRSAEDARIEVRAGADVVRVTIDARLRGLLPLPGLTEFRLTSNASAYAERFRPAGSSVEW